MKREIRTTHDLAMWLRAISSKSDSIDELIADLEYNAPEDWKICKKCDNLYPLSSYGLNVTKGDGHKAYCKKCTNTQKKNYGRRIRAEKRISPSDLMEIQRIRKLKGMNPLPYGLDAPARGCPRDGKMPTKRELNTVMGGW